MSSTVAWLDTSAEEQRRARELIALFSQSEARDELGLGQVRDVLSESLFPGTSVLHTRARYFLIVPWCFQKAAAQSSSLPLAVRSQRIERRLIPTLQKTSEEGVIGRQAGAAVKTLPSAMFWGGLERFGILARAQEPSQLRGALPTIVADGEDEPAARRIGDWHPTIPRAPQGFPDSLDGGLSLSRDEAGWLRDRILESTPGTMLEHLVRTPAPAGDLARAPWEDPRSADAPEAVRAVLALAHGFAQLMHGAAFTYNLMVAERYVDEGFTALNDPVGFYRSQVEGWLSAVATSAVVLSPDRLPELWRLVDASGANVSLRTRAFVTRWAELVDDGSVGEVLGDPHTEARQLIRDRERGIKGNRSRLTNTKLLGTWGGSSGAGQLIYRWTQVRRIVADIHHGLAAAEGAHA